MTYDHLATNLRYFRTLRKITQQALARDVTATLRCRGFSQNYVSLLERGVRPGRDEHVAAPRPSLSTFRSLRFSPGRGSSARQRIARSSSPPKFIAPRPRWGDHDAGIRCRRVDRKSCLRHRRERLFAASCHLVCAVPRACGATQSESTRNVRSDRDVALMGRPIRAGVDATADRVISSAVVGLVYDALVSAGARR